MCVFVFVMLWLVGWLLVCFVCLLVYFLVCVFVVCVGVCAVFVKMCSMLFLLVNYIGIAFFNQ